MAKNAEGAGGQPYGYSGDAAASRPPLTGGDAQTDAMPAVSPVARHSSRGRWVRAGLAGTALAGVLGGAYLLGQVRGPDQASASGGPGSTPTATETATATATPGSNDHELQPGQCIDLNASGNDVIIVQGDVTINGDHTYDNDKQSAAEAVLQNGDYDICAPWGADVQQTDQNQADCILGADTTQALDKGFQRVTIFEFQNGHMVQGSR